MPRRPQPIQYLQGIWNDILTTDGSAELVARSFAIGTFLALLPTFGFGVLIGLAIMVLVPTLHKPALLTAFAVWNPLFQIPLYSLGITLGGILFQDLPVLVFDLTFWDQVFHLTRRVFVGTMIVACVVTILSYLSVYASIRLSKGKPVFRQLSR